MQKRKLEELNLLDDFLFGAMVTHPEVGEAFVRKLLRIIFGREFGSLKVIPQKVYYGKDTDKHGARLDVYLEEDAYVPESIDPENIDPEKNTDAGKEARIRAKCSNIYDIEPDKRNGKSAVAALPKRVRFYHGVIDAQLLRSGADYESMKNVTVIMIVPYDPFGFDRTVYTIKRSCRELPDMPYDDGSRTLYLYTRGSQGDCTEELKELLRYMEETTRENAVSEELREIQQMVESVKTDEGVSIEYMKSYEREWLIREEGLREGREEERVNTERERKRAMEAEGRAEKAEGRAEEAEGRAEEAEGRVKKAEGRAEEAEGRAEKAEERAKKAEEQMRQLQEELERMRRNSK